MKIYLAGRYGRRLELLGYAWELAQQGHEVTSRWLSGIHGAMKSDFASGPVMTAEEELRFHLMAEHWQGIVRLAGEVVRITTLDATMIDQIPPGVGLAVNVADAQAILAVNAELARLRALEMVRAKRLAAMSN